MTVGHTDIPTYDGQYLILENIFAHHRTDKEVFSCHFEVISEIIGSAWHKKYQTHATKKMLDVIS